MIGKIGQRP